MRITPTHHDVDDDDADFEQFESESNDDEFERTSHANNKKDENYQVVLSEKDWTQKIRVRAITYLSRREYSRTELSKKVVFSLRGFACEGAQANDLTIVNAVLDELTRQNWQSDERVAASVAKVKGERFGVSRVKHELKQQGLDNALIATQIEALKSTEHARALEVWRKKFGESPADLKEKAKQIRFMAGRGFSFDVINRIIKNADNEYDDGEY